MSQFAATGYEPKVDDVITVELPDERTRARIVKLINAKMCIAEILHFTVQHKSHSYKKGSLVPCRYETDRVMHLAGWKAMDEAELDRMAQPEPVPAPEVAAPVVRKKGGKDAIAAGK